MRASERWDARRRRRRRQRVPGRHRRVRDSEKRGPIGPVPRLDRHALLHRRIEGGDRRGVDAGRQFFGGDRPVQRLTQLLDLPAQETEKYISDLVVSKTIYARIDRPAQIVSFEKKRDADEVLNEWSGNMKSLLGLLERIDHLITKEEMMARIQPVSEKASTKVSAKA